MSNKEGGLILGCCCFVWIIFSLITAVIIFVHNNNKLDSYGVMISLEHFTQIAEDWHTPPYTDIVVIKTDNRRSSCPKTHPHEVIQYTWPGFHAYCDCFEAGYSFENALYIFISNRVAQQSRVEKIALGLFTAAT